MASSSTVPAVTMEQLQSIAREAAFLVAALSDKMMSEEDRAREVAACLEILVPQLWPLGVLDPYLRGEGMGIW